MREIDGEALVFQQRLNQMWEEYRVLYDRVSQTAAVGAEWNRGRARARQGGQGGLKRCQAVRG